MRKKVLGTIVCMGMLVFMSACSENSCKEGKMCDDRVYVGVLPAADAAGVHYTLTLDYDDDMKDGDFDMVQTYLNVDSLGVSTHDAFKSKGDFTVENRDGVKYLKLVEKRGDNAPVYFKQANDSTLIMVNDSLQEAASGLNYSLSLVK